MGVFGSSLFGLSVFGADGPAPSPPTPNPFVTGDVSTGDNIDAPYGWSFEAVSRASGVARPIYPAAGGSLDYSYDRDVSKTLRGLVFLPEDAREIDPVRDEIRVTFIDGDARKQMGYYVATESVRQRDVLLDPDTNEVADLLTLGFGDRMALLIRSDGTSQTVRGGFDPSQVAIDLLRFVDVPYSIEGSASMAGDTVVWEGDKTILDKFAELAVLAGHRPPWMNHDGVIRSVVSRTPQELDDQVVPVEELAVEASSIIVTDTYLGAPNVVIVVANSGGLIGPIAGRWDAPSIAPNSFARRGYQYTHIETRQGVLDAAHAEAVARSIGERAVARSLDFRCRPTARIDGPTILKYDGALWVTKGYSIDLGPNGMMSVTAEELTEPPGAAPIVQGG